MSTLLSARGLKISFGGIKAADGIDLDVEDGEFLAIIGPNGAGKTTFINMATGYLRPNAGEITFNGHSVVGLRPRRIVDLGIARSFQLPQLFMEHTVLENVALAIASRGRFWSPSYPLLAPPVAREAEDIIDKFGLDDIAARRADTLNEGARKLTDIAMALALKPRLLLMDEPTSGVAASEKMEVVETLARVLRSLKITAVFVEHDMEVVSRFADRVAVWSRGRISAIGAPDVVFNDANVQRDVIGVPLPEATL